MTTHAAAISGTQAQLRATTRSSQMTAEDAADAAVDAALAAKTAADAAAKAAKAETDRVAAAKAAWDQLFGAPVPTPAPAPVPTPVPTRTTTTSRFRRWASNSSFIAVALVSFLAFVATWLLYSFASHYALGQGAWASSPWFGFIVAAIVGVGVLLTIGNAAEETTTTTTTTTA